MKRCLFFIFVSLISHHSFSQSSPVKFGEVDLADLKMTSYEKDTSAPAVILCNYGYFNSQLLQFTQILRIKILKTEGYAWANKSYPGNFSSSLRGVTVNLENGKAIKEKLRNESIFVNRVTEGIYETRIAMPDVKVGSVIDLEFRFQGIPAEWRFQEEIPVRYCELVFENSPYVKFTSNFFGFEPLASSTPTRWIAKDMPAFKDEPFINSNENYLTKREFELLEIRIGTYTKIFSGTWEDVNWEVFNNPNFRFSNSTSAQLNEIAKKIRESGGSKETMIKEAFETAKTIKWNEVKSLYTSNPALSYLLKMKVGNSADINSFLYQLLKKLEIDVYPVAISSRDNGLISKFLPSLHKLNYFVVLANTDEKSYILDATEKLMPYYLLPLRSINGEGRIIDPLNGKWVDLKTDRKDSEMVTYDLKLDENFSLNGSLTSVKLDYSAFEFRKRFSGFNSQDEFQENFESAKPGLTINSYEVLNLDSIYDPVIEKYDITAKNLVSQLGDEMHFIPLIYNQLKENPFRPETRKYPVDFGYCKELTIISHIRVPEGFTIKSLPASFKTELSNGGASFSYEVAGNEKDIRITSRFFINKPVFLMNEYGNLKGFYDTMIKKHSEPVVLSRKQQL